MCEKGGKVTVSTAVERGMAAVWKETWRIIA
jgi:hypothetical protein